MCEIWKQPPRGGAIEHLCGIHWEKESSRSASHKALVFWCLLSTMGNWTSVKWDGLTQSSK